MARTGTRIISDKTTLVAVDDTGQDVPWDPGVEAIEIHAAGGDVFLKSGSPVAPGDLAASIKRETEGVVVGAATTGMSYLIPQGFSKILRKTQSGQGGAADTHWAVRCRDTETATAIANPEP